MKRIISLCVIYVLLFLASGCSHDKNHERAALRPGSDTVYTAEAAMLVFDKDPQRALVIIDSALLVGNISDDLADFLRAKVYGQSTTAPQYDSADAILKRLIESDFVEFDPGNREMVLDLLVYVSNMREDNASYLRWATEKVDFCRQRGVLTEALRTEAEIGYVLASIGEEESGLTKLNGVISSLDNERHFNEMDACVIALKRKIFVLNTLQRSSEIIPLAKRIITKINDFRENPDVYADDSYRMLPNEERRLNYCDFYTSQAYGYLASAYASLNRADSSRRYLALFERSDYAETLYGMQTKGTIYRKLGDYGKMLTVFAAIEKQMGGDTVNQYYADMLYGRAKAAEAYGNNHAAVNYLYRYSDMIQVLNKQLLESRVYYYAARYHIKEEQMKLENEKFQSKKLVRIFIVCSVLLLIAIVAVVWMLVQRRDINRKNRVLVEQISNVMKWKDLLENHDNELRKASNGVGPSTVAASDASDASHDGSQQDSQPTVPPEKMPDGELFNYLSNIIRSEKLFTDPSFGRQTLSDRFHLSDHRIGAAFARGSEYGSLPEFVRELRLEYSCHLLAEHPEMSINDVATASGFSSSTVYCRYFKLKYEVTPTIFRNQLS